MIADDEALARRRLVRMLEEIEGTTLVGQADDGMDTLAKLAALAPDLVLLDISMPGPSGLEIARMHPRTSIVFTTASEAHAVEAFALEATDYLLKPIELPRLKQALARAASRLQQAPLARVERGATIVEAQHGRTTHYIDARSIPRIYSEDKLSCFHLGGNEYHLRESLNQLEELLASHKFIRCSRGELLNTRAIVGLRNRGATVVAVLAQGVEIAISRRRLAAVRLALRAP